MTRYQRYALYYAPEAKSALHQFGSQWLGWDAVAKREHPRVGFGGLSAQTHVTLTETPRRYGFHATLKPPFRLADGTDFDGLRASILDLSSRRSMIADLGLVLSRLGSFFALTIDRDPSTVSDLAADCVQHLDRFRAPPTDEELARRRAAPLTVNQEAQLLRWGYPYVMEEFRFHLTLTGKIDTSLVDAVSQVLKKETRRLFSEPFKIESVCLFGDPGNGEAFEFLERFPLLKQ